MVFQSKFLCFQLFILWGFGKFTWGYLSSPRFGFIRPCLGSLRTTLPVLASTTNDETLDLQTRRQLHEWVKEQDPEWYQEYVLDILGKDICETKWPAVLGYKGDDVILTEQVETDGIIGTTDMTINTTFADDVPGDNTTIRYFREQDQNNGDVENANESIDTNQIFTISSNIDIASNSTKQDNAISISQVSLNDMMESSLSSSSLLSSSPSSSMTSTGTSEQQMSNEVDSGTISPLSTSNFSATTGIVGQNINVPAKIVTGTPTSTPNQKILSNSEINSNVMMDRQMNLNHVISPQSPLSQMTQNTTTENSSVMSSVKEEDSIRTADDEISSSTPEIIQDNDILLSESNQSSLSSQDMDKKVAPIVDLPSSRLQVAGSKEIVSDDTFTTKIEAANTTTVNLTESKTTRDLSRMSINRTIPLGASKFGTTPSTVDRPMDQSSKVIVYRDSKQGWKTVNMNVLIDLGYIQVEIMELLPDALAIIVQEQIRRPRTLGLPSPWRVGPKDTRTRVQIVSDQSQADDLVEKLNKEEIEGTKRRSRTPKPAPEKQEWTKTSASMENLKRDTVGPYQDDKRRTPLPQTMDNVSSASKDDRSQLEKTTKMDSIKRNMERPLPLRNEGGNSSSDSSDGPTNSDRQVGSTISPSSFEVPDTAVAIDSQLETRNIPSEEPEFKKPVVVLYKDIGNTLTATPLSNITLLGYTQEEIRTLQGEALAIIVADQVPRPRLGIPPQWKITFPDETPEIEFVDSMEEAEARINDEKEKRRRRRSGQTEINEFQMQTKAEEVAERKRTSTKVERSADDTLPGTRQSQSPRRMQEVESQLSEEQRLGRPKQKPNSNGINDTMERVRSPPSSNRVTQNERQLLDPKADEMRKSRPTSRRAKVNDDGSPKRIYNARSIPNKRDREVLADPPDPSSRLWMDMDTFRSLLRSEAQLRLRILGEDWAPTVKQESDWRLNLYKNWLWTLHNGVGESIVPPSRYERARKTNEQRQREMEDTTSSRKPTIPRKNAKRRPKDL